MLHKDSKWYQQWKDFRDNNVVFNRECPHLRTARWQGSGRHSLSAPRGRAPDRGGDWGPRGQSLRQSHPACEQRSAGLRRPEGKHPGRLGRQGLCRRGWVTILTRASVVVGQAGASAPPTHAHPSGAAVDLAPTHPASQARNQLKAQRALPSLGHLASLVLTGSPVPRPLGIPRSLCFLCSESSCQ